MLSRSALSRSWFRTARTSVRGQSWTLRPSCSTSSLDRRAPPAGSSSSDLDRISSSPLEVMWLCCCSTLNNSFSRTPDEKENSCENSRLDPAGPHLGL